MQIPNIPGVVWTHIIRCSQEQALEDRATSVEVIMPSLRLVIYFLKTVGLHRKKSLCTENRKKRFCKAEDMKYADLHAKHELVDFCRALYGVLNERCEMVRAHYDDGAVLVQYVQGIVDACGE